MKSEDVEFEELPDWMKLLYHYKSKDFRYVAPCGAVSSTVLTTENFKKVNCPYCIKFFSDKID